MGLGEIVPGGNTLGTRYSEEYTGATSRNSQLTGPCPIVLLGTFIPLDLAVMAVMYVVEKVLSRFNNYLLIIEHLYLGKKRIYQIKDLSVSSVSNVNTNAVLWSTNARTLV